MTVAVASGKKTARAIEAGVRGAVLRVFGQRGLAGVQIKRVLRKEIESEAPERVLYALRRN
jgi:hypothetical protein